MFNACGRNAKITAFTGQNENAKNMELFSSIPNHYDVYSNIITKNPYFKKQLQNILDKQYIYVNRLGQSSLYQGVHNQTKTNKNIESQQTQTELQQSTMIEQNQITQQQSCSVQNTTNNMVFNDDEVLDVYEPDVSLKQNIETQQSNESNQQNQNISYYSSPQMYSKPVNNEQLDVLYSPMQQYPATIITDNNVQEKQLSIKEAQNISLGFDNNNQLQESLRESEKKIQNIEQNLLQSQKQQELQLQISQRQQSEIEKLQQQLIQQNQLVKQQMEIIQQQQLQLKQQNEEFIVKQNTQTGQDIPLKLSKNSTAMLSQHSLNEQSYTSHMLQSSQTSKQCLSKSQFTIPNCTNPRLTLTTTSLCAFDGIVKMFEINLSQPKIVQFYPESYKIMIQYKNIPMTIQAQNEADYVKWYNCIQRCINNARQQILNKQLLMKLDKKKMLLYVYKNGEQEPDIIYKIGKCDVQLFQDVKNNFGTVKVKCFDGKKFSFSDTLDVCEEWVGKLSECGGLTSYL